MNDLDRARLDRDLEKMQTAIQEAQHTADLAMNNVSSHEKVCALRYEMITKQLDNIPRIFTALGSLQRTVYIGVGIFTSVGVAIEVIRRLHP